MTSHHFNHFHLVLIQNIGVLEKLSMVVTQKEIMQIGKVKHLEDLGKTMNEDSRGLRRHYKGRLLFPCPKTSYMEGNTQKTKN
jgi:hypothetical protein